MSVLITTFALIFQFLLNMTTVIIESNLIVSYTYLKSEGNENFDYTQILLFRT